MGHLSRNGVIFAVLSSLVAGIVCAIGGFVTDAFAVSLIGLILAVVAVIACRLQGLSIAIFIEVGLLVSREWLMSFEQIMKYGFVKAFFGDVFDITYIARVTTLVCVILFIVSLCFIKNSRNVRESSSYSASASSAPAEESAENN